MPKVSVIIPTHSRPKLLPRAVESAQSAGTDVEVIVVDDASTDETAEVCRNLKGIKSVRAERNQKVAGARNIGILASTAEYISFLDDDDVRLPGTLDTQIECLKSCPEAGLVYGKAYLNEVGKAYAAQSEYPQGDVFWELLVQDFIPVMSAVFRKACLFKVGLLNKTIPGVDDWDLWVRIAECYPVVMVDDYVAIWRGFTPTSNQGSSNFAALLALASSIHKHQWLRLPRALSAPASKRSEVRQQFLNSISDILIWNAAYELKQGHSLYARKNLKTALKLHPLRAARPWTISLLGQTYLPTALRLRLGAENPTVIGSE